MSVTQLLNKVKGQQIRIPCLHSLSPSWHARLNPNYDNTVEESIDAWRRKWLPDTISYRRNVGANCAFFARTMTPEATKFNMQLVGTLASWVFAWDDESLNVIKTSIQENPTTSKSPELLALNFSIARSFYEIGVLIREGTEHEDIREFVCETLCDYVTAAVRMEDAFQEEVIQDIQEYIDNRMGSSCVYGMIAISLYASHIDIPTWFLHHSLAQEMMRHINIMVALDNDIVSAHHELNCKHVDNMVLLLVYHHGMTPQEAVDHCCQLIRESYAAFERLESEILKFAAGHNIVRQAQTFISCLKDVRIGLVNWLYNIKRYFDFQPEEGEREVLISLE